MEKLRTEPMEGERWERSLGSGTAIRRIRFTNPITGKDGVQRAVEDDTSRVRMGSGGS